MSVRFYGKEATLGEALCSKSRMVVLAGQKLGSMSLSKCSSGTVTLNEMNVSSESGRLRGANERTSTTSESGASSKPALTCAKIFDGSVCGAKRDATMDLPICESLPGCSTVNKSVLAGPVHTVCGIGFARFDGSGLCMVLYGIVSRSRFLPPPDGVIGVPNELGMVRAELRPLFSSAVRTSVISFDNSLGLTSGVGEASLFANVD